MYIFFNKSKNTFAPTGTFLNPPMLVHKITQILRDTLNTFNCIQLYKSRSMPLSLSAFMVVPALLGVYSMCGNDQFAVTKKETWHATKAFMEYRIPIQTSMVIYNQTNLNLILPICGCSFSIWISKFFLLLNLLQQILHSNSLVSWSLFLLLFGLILNELDFEITKNFEEVFSLLGSWGLSGLLSSRQVTSSSCILRFLSELLPSEKLLECCDSWSKGFPASGSSSPSYNTNIKFTKNVRAIKAFILL